MNTVRIALANIPFPATPEESVTLAERAIGQAAIERADIICFPECFVPGYRGMGHAVPPADPAFLERAWSAVASAAAKANLAVVLGTERVLDGGLLITALVINRDGTVAGFQDKVQLDPSEESYLPGRVGAARFPIRPPDIRYRHLPRRLALSRDGPLGGPARRAHRVPPASPRSRTRRLRAFDFRRPCELIP